MSKWVLDPIYHTRWVGLLPEGRGDRRPTLPHIIRSTPQIVSVGGSDDRPRFSTRQAIEKRCYSLGVAIAAAANGMSDETGSPSSAPSVLGRVTLALLVVNLLATGFAVFSTQTVSKKVNEIAKVQKERPPKAKGEEGSETEEEGEVLPPGPVVAFEPIVVNLNEPGKPRYLKAVFEIEVENPETAKVLEERKRIVRDELFRYLSSLTASDTAGEENKTKIQTEVKTRVATVLGEDYPVRRAYFLEFIVN